MGLVRLFYLERKLAELSDLQIKITANTSGLTDISKEAGKASKEIDNLGKQGISTFSQFDRTIKSSALSIAGYAAAFAAAVVTAREFVRFISQSITDSANQQKAYAALANSLKNVGIAYKDVASQVQSTFDTIQRTTTFSGEEQARALQVLTQLTGDYEVASKSLKTTLDFSVGAGISFEQAAKGIGNALEGNVEILARYEPSLKGVRRSQFLLLTDSQKMEVVLGALNKKYAGSADALANTYAGALIQVKNAQQEFRASVGDFITNAPQFIALLQEIAATYLDITEKVQDYRTDQEKGNQLADAAIDKIEALSKAFFIAGNVLKLFGSIFGAVFNAIIIVTNAQLAAFSKLISLILKGELAILKFAQALPEIPGIGKPIEIDPNTLRNLQSTIGTVEAFSNLSVEGVKDAFKDLQGNIQGVADAVENIGDTSQIEAFFDRVRERTEELKGKLNDTTVATQGNNNALEDLAGGADKLSKEQKKLIKDKEQFLKSLLNEGESLAKEIALFGATDEEIANYEKNMLLATARSLGFGNSLDAVIERLAQMKVELARLNLKEELADQLKGVFDLVKTESQKIGEELANNINTILQNVVLNPDLINFEQAQEVINQLTQQALQAQAKAQADLIQQEKEAYIERLKNSDSFFDQLKGGFLDFVNQVESNGELVSQFFADTLSQMSQNFSDLFYNVLTGKFDNLVDVAKNAFKAILRAFLDMVSAIVTRQIIVSIGGLFDFGGIGGGKGGGGAAGAASQAVGIGTDIGGLFGSGGALSILGSGLGIGGGGALAGAGTLGGTSIAAGASVFGSAPSGALLAPGFFATAGAAVTIVGAVLAAAALAITLIAPLLKKTPHFAFKFESIKTEVGERAATVAELLDPEIFSEEIFKTLSSHGGKGAFSGKERDALKDAIQKAIAGTVDQIQAIINKLPEDMVEILNDALLNTTVDMETKIGRSNLLGFDAKGAKEIKKRLEAFFQGDLQGRFLFAIRDFFQFAFEQLGVLPEKASAFIDAEFEKFKKAKSPEERAQIGQELLASFNAFVDAFNIVSGNVNDAISITIANTKSLAKELGFDAVPSIGELRAELAKLLENAELDPETVQKYADLRNAIVQGILDIGNAISGLIGKIQSLNQTIIGFGGAGVDLGPILDQASADLINFFKANAGDLSLAEQEAFLDEIGSIAQQQLAEEQAAFAAEQAAQQAAAEAAKQAIQVRIDGLNKEKDKINEIFRERIDALNEELRIAEDFAQLTESIRKTLDSILFSPESVLTGVEQVNALQGRIANLQADISKATDPEDKLKIAQQIQEAFSNLFDAAGEAFGVNSPEFVAIFDQVTGGLEDLANLTSTQGRSVEEINAEIEKLTAENQEVLKSIDAKIEAANAQISAISQQTANNTFKASQQLQETFEWLRGEYLRILQERTDQLDEATTTGFENELEGIEDIATTAHDQLDALHAHLGMAEDTNGILDEINANIAAAVGGGTAGGSGVGGADGNPFTAMAGGGIIREPILGVGRSGRRYLLGEAGPEMVMPFADMNRAQASPPKRVDIFVHGDNPGAIDVMYQKIRKDLAKDLAKDMANEIHPGTTVLRKSVQMAAGAR